MDVVWSLSSADRAPCLVPGPDHVLIFAADEVGPGAVGVVKRYAGHVARSSLRVLMSTTGLDRVTTPMFDF